VANDALTTNPEAFPMVAKPFIHALALMVIRNGIDINVFTTATNSQPEAAK
jgi:hypothetical protein